MFHFKTKGLGPPKNSGAGGRKPKTMFKGKVHFGNVNFGKNKVNRINVKTRQYFHPNERRPVENGHWTEPIVGNVDGAQGAPQNVEEPEPMLEEEFSNLGIWENYKLRAKERKNREDYCMDEWNKLFIDHQEMFLRWFAPHSDWEESCMCLDCGKEFNPANPTCTSSHLVSKLQKVNYSIYATTVKTQ